MAQRPSPSNVRQPIVRFCRAKKSHDLYPFNWRNEISVYCDYLANLRFLMRLNGCNFWVFIMYAYCLFWIFQAPCPFFPNLFNVCRQRLHWINERHSREANIGQKLAKYSGVAKSPAEASLSHFSFDSLFSPPYTCKSYHPVDCSFAVGTLVAKQAALRIH